MDLRGEAADVEITVTIRWTTDVCTQVRLTLYPDMLIRSRAGHVDDSTHTRLANVLSKLMGRKYKKSWWPGMYTPTKPAVKCAARK